MLSQEVFSYEVLEQKRKEVGEKAFLVEYIWCPFAPWTASTESIWSPASGSWSSSLWISPSRRSEWTAFMLASIIGCENHPTHISVLASVGGHPIQIY